MKKTLLVILLSILAPALFSCDSMVGKTAPVVTTILPAPAPSVPCEVHRYQAIVSIPATCTQTGETVYVCVDCKESYVLQTPLVSRTVKDNACIHCKKKASEGLQYTSFDDGETLFIWGIGSCEDTDLLIPDTHNGRAVKGIASSVFQKCRKLQRVSIPESVTTIEFGAFRACSSLETINIPQEVTVKPF